MHMDYNIPICITPVCLSAERGPRSNDILGATRPPNAQISIPCAMFQQKEQSSFKKWLILGARNKQDKLQSAGMDDK